MPYIYFIKSIRHNWIYVGSTDDIKKRIESHNSGAVRSTKYRRPYKLLYAEYYPTIAESTDTRERVKIK